MEGEEVVVVVMEKVVYESRHYLEIFEKDKLVYLSSEASEVLEMVDPGECAVYVLMQ